MKDIFFTLLLGLTGLASAQTPCDTVPADLLVLGDSQTGASWAPSYYGNFLQKCLKDDPAAGRSFVIYGRGGTQPAHWLTSAGLDKIATIQRDPENNHKNIGVSDQVPLCKKRLRVMLEAHHPRRVLAFFGDNLLSASEAEIKNQFAQLVKTIREYGTDPRNCYIMTPTYEMDVTEKRNVPAKNLANTLKVIKAVKAAAGNDCRVIDSVELMGDSALLLQTQLLKRAQSEGMGGCLGAAGNDNIHVCGEAAKDLADRVCGILRQP